MKTLFLAVLLGFFTIAECFAQGTAINTTGAPADNSAMLDVSNSGKGILIPRIALSDTSDAVTIPLPATSLVVYNTYTGGGLVPGFYYNTGTPGAPRWKQLLSNPANTALNMSGYKITNLATCTNNPDAANKAYVDAQIALVGGSGSSTVPTMISDESTGGMNFRAACEYCRTLTEGGYTDWRLPTYYEYWTVLSTTNYAIPSSGSSNYVWAMDRDHNYGYYHLIMVLSNGDMSYSSGSSSYRVRCVR